MTPRFAVAVKPWEDVMPEQMPRFTVIATANNKHDSIANVFGLPRAAKPEVCA